MMQGVPHNKSVEQSKVAKNGSSMGQAWVKLCFFVFSSSSSWYDVQSPTSRKNDRLFQATLTND